MTNPDSPHRQTALSASRHFGPACYLQATRYGALIGGAAGLVYGLAIVYVTDIRGYWEPSDLDKLLEGMLFTSTVWVALGAALAIIDSALKSTHKMAHSHLCWTLACLLLAGFAWVALTFAGQLILGFADRYAHWRAAMVVWPGMVTAWGLGLYARLSIASAN